MTGAAPGSRFRPGPAGLLAGLAGVAVCLVFVLAWGAGPASARAANSDCLLCHDVDSAANITDAKFDFAATPVDRETACMKCHWEPAGSHPYHNIGWNCGSCHTGMGFFNAAAVPSVPTTYGWFGAAYSAEADADALHVIHANPTWAGTVTKNGRQCASCHAAAACTACHESAGIDPSHWDHTWDATSGAYWPGTGPSGAVYGRGTNVGNEGERNLTSGITCSNATCHTAPSGASAPVLTEDYDPDITYTGAGWARVNQAGYTGNSYSRSNAAGARAELVFNGGKVELISGKHPYFGKIRVYLDSVEVTTADLYSPTVVKQFVAYASPKLSSGPHTITVEVLRQKNAAARDYYGQVDAFRVFPRAEMAKGPCTNCHAEHADGSTHLADPGSGGVTILSGSTDHGTYETGGWDVGAWVDCAMCHAGDLMPLHSGATTVVGGQTLTACQVCHRTTDPTVQAVVAAGFTTCSACHTTSHTAADAGHEAEYNAGPCEACHDDDWSVPVEACANCHSVSDNRPPVTLSNAVAAYVGFVRIQLTPYDVFPSSGVAHTYYRVDGGVTREGLTIDVSAPAAGSMAHSIEFWSVDGLGREEWPHKTAAFTVTPDAVPPVTTSDALEEEEYVGPATVHFSVTDNATVQGTCLTYYRIDGGATMTGNVAIVPQPASGTAERTVQFWSVDRCGNVETPQSVGFTVVADNVGPTMTSSLMPYQRSGVIIDFYVTDPAPSSGIAASYLSIQGASTVYWPVGGSNNLWWRGYASSVPTQGPRGVEYWAVDKAGNVGSHATTTVVMDWTAPSTASDAVATYNGTATISLTATDAYSPVAVTKYRVDSGAWTTGTTIVVAPPASGGAAHTVYYYSVDAAVNTESTKSRSFTVYAVDTTPPSGTMSVNSGAQHTSVTAGTVNSAVTDGGSGMYQMRIDPGTGTYGSWQTYAASRAFTLPSGDGVKTVRAEYKDNAGNVLSLEDTITLDTVAPNGTMSVNGGAAATTSTAVSVDSSVTDSLSGMYQMRVDPGTGAYGAWVAYTASCASVLTTPNGTKTVRAEYKDYAGNIRTLSDTILLAVPTTDVVASTTYEYTGGDQTFTVPAGVTTLSLDVYGAQGGSKTPGVGGLGGRVSVVVSVTPGQELTLRVGGAGMSGPGGWPNGGDGDGSCGAGGGGSSSVLAGPAVWVEAGGGGGADHDPFDGGAGGYQGWLPGGNGLGEDGSAGGGGGWNGGVANPVGNEHSGSGEGGSSYIATGTGTLTQGVRGGNGKVVVGYALSGTIQFAWDDPAPGSWATVWVYDAADNLVYTNSDPFWDPPGWFVVRVPLNSLEYRLEASWYDAGTDTEDWSYGSTFIDEPGEVYTWWY